MLKIATREDYDEIFNAGLRAAQYQPYPVDEQKMHNVINLFLNEPNEKSIILLYMDGKKCKAALGARVEEAIYHVGTTAVEVLWWLDPSCKLDVSNQMLAAYEYWAKKVKCRYLLLTAAHSDQIERVEKVYKRKKFRPAERAYIKEI